MAKKSTIEKNKRRQRMAKRDAAKRADLRAIVRDRARPAEERFAAQLKLAELPRNGAQVRVRNRCGLTGRRAAPTASSGCRVSRSGSWPRRARCRAW